MRSTPGELDPIGQVGADRLDPAGERGVFEGCGPSACWSSPGDVLDDEAGVGGDGALEPGDDQERA